jgi:hypothetical protein
VTDIVKRLEGRGLLERTLDTVDKRRQLMKATVQGELLIKQSVPLLQNRFQERLAELREWEQIQLLASLQRIAEMMNAEDLDAAPMLASGALTASPETIKEATQPPQENSYSGSRGISPPAPEGRILAISLG